VDKRQQIQLLQNLIMELLGHLLILYQQQEEVVLQQVVKLQHYMLEDLLQLT